MKPKRIAITGRKKNALAVHAARRAIKLLDGENLDVKLTIVGDGPLKQEVADIIKKYKLAEKIKLVGAKDRSELSKFYNSASAFILPSIYEGQALTLLEAWAAKMPVIVTRTGDNTYLVKEGVNGYFIGDNNNPESIAKAIKETLGNKNLNKIGKNGYNLVKENYKWNKSMMATKTLFETLV